MSRDRNIIAPTIENSSSAAEELRSHGPRRQNDAAFGGDPSIHFIVDAPKRPSKFRSWFALAILAGVLLALAIVAITT